MEVVCPFPNRSTFHTRLMVRPPNQHRVSHACEACRHRKTKCSGERPVCAHCQSYSIACSYAQNKREKTRQELVHSRSLISRLQRLLEELQPELGPISRQSVQQYLRQRSSPSSEGQSVDNDIQADMRNGGSSKLA